MVIIVITPAHTHTPNSTNMSCHLPYKNTIYIQCFFKHPQSHLHHTYLTHAPHKTGWNTNCPQVTQFCHLNHLFKKVVRDHDDASLGGWCSMKTRFCWAMKHMKWVWNKNDKQTCPYQSSLFWKLAGHLLLCAIYCYVIKNRMYMYIHMDDVTSI